MNCNRCSGTGFLNIDHLGDFDEELEHELVVQKLQGENYHIEDFDFLLIVIEKELAGLEEFQVCDCCGDGASWYGQPGEHYMHDDPMGKHGPYAYNGGTCECH